ncbi:MAG: T9SS type A sorting domain-containing protein, partial [Gemmatimonadetes bacterium]|nr:T9SS type A sorting domain-containing protein [Gemmatimonadota bacterium]
YQIPADQLRTEPVRPSIREHGSTVSARSLPPQDSVDLGVMPSAVVTQSEISTFVDPNDANTVLVSTNTTDWNGTSVIQLYGTGMYWSTDGGASWSGNDFGPGGVANSGDPAVVIRENDGRWVVGYISTGFGQGVSYTTDQGSNWSHVNLFPSGTLDKNHLMVDNHPTSPFNGNLYSSWTSFSGANVNKIEIVRSTDGGATWDPTATNISAGVASGSHDQGVNIQTGPNGEVYAVFAIYDCWPCEEIAYGMNKSLDGGATWQGEARVITNTMGHRNTALPNTGIRRNSFPTMAVDRSGGPDDGAVYVAWTNQGVPGVNVGDPDIYIAKSTDGAATFGTPVRINQDATTNAQWFPWISVDQFTGMITAIFYDRRDDPADTQTNTYMATSSDGGATWEDFRVSDVSFVPAAIPGLASGYSGDYLGMAVHNGQAYPSFADNRTGNYLTYVSPILLAEGADPNPPTAVTAASDFNTPTGAQVDWTDAVTTVGGAPLTDFSVDILRDSVFLINVDQGVETFTDSGLTDGQSYMYTLLTRDDVTDSTSSSVNVNVTAGGSPVPAAPASVSCSADSVSATISWTNPSTQDDGTGLDDFAGIRIYRDSVLLIELARTPGDAGTADSYVDSPPIGFTYTYEVAAIDNESTVHESVLAGGGTCFVGGAPVISVTPGALTVNVGPGAMTTQGVTVDNPGFGFLDYTVALNGLGGGGRDEFGSTAGQISTFAAYRGNVYQATSDVTLTLIDVRLNITTSTTLEFFVYESAAPTGNFNKVFSTTTTSGTGNTFFGSGAMSFPLQSGMYYMIGAGWQGGVIAYHDGGATGVPAPVSFGSALYRAGANAWPPPTTTNVTGVGTQLTSVAVETATVATGTLLSATSGSIAPMGSTSLDIQADGLSLGTVAGTLDITHNAAGGFTSVPVTINVVDATDAPTVAIEPSALALHAGIPNPFRHETSIRFDLPQAADVRLAVFDVTGRRVRTLAHGVMDAGFHTTAWDGRAGDGRRASSGVYFIALETGEQSLRKKVVMLR